MPTRLAPRPLLFTAVVLLAGTSTSAQLSGEYTIDPAGKGPRNFATFPQAIAALDEKGVDGAVVLAVAPGTHRGAFELSSVEGASAAHRIVIRNGGKEPVVFESVGGAAIGFSAGARHWVLDGLTFGKTTDADGAIRGEPDTSDIEIVRCRFTAERDRGAIHVAGRAGTAREWHIHHNHFHLVGTRHGLHLSEVAAFDIHDNVFILRDVQHCLYLINHNDAQNHIHHNIFTGTTHTAVGIAASNLNNHVTDNLFAITTQGHAIDTFGTRTSFNRVYRNTFAITGEGGAILLSHPTMMHFRSDRNLFACTSSIGTTRDGKEVRHSGLAAWQEVTAALPLGTSDRHSAAVAPGTRQRYPAVFELLRTGELPEEPAAADAALADIGRLLASSEVAEIRLGICAAGRAQAKGRPAIARLAGLCGHADPAVRGAAAEALGKIRYTAEITVPDIQRLLAEDDAGVLLNAVRALAAFGPFARPALPRLEELEEAPGADCAALRRAAAHTIRAITGNPPARRKD